MNPSENPQSGPVKTGMRQSNMELLRIVAMLMVLALHATYETFHYPRASYVQAQPLSWLGIITTATASIGCVDVFVLITGWFGTRFKLRTVGRMLFQTAFAVAAVAGLMALAGLPVRVDIRGFLNLIFGYWFVNSYLVLCLLSPVLNAFVERSTEAELRRYILLFYLFVIPASFVFADLNRGFAAIPFMGLYLLGRYARLYLNPRMQGWGSWRFFGIWAAVVAFSSLVLWLSGLAGQKAVGALVPVVTAYTNPLTILAALMLLMTFARMRFESRIVNGLAAGCLMAYLTHQCPLIRTWYFYAIRELDGSLPTFLFIPATAAYIVLIYLLSVCLDRVRQWMWTGLEALCGRIRRAHAQGRDGLDCRE